MKRRSITAFFVVFAAFAAFASAQVSRPKVDLPAPLSPAVTSAFVEFDKATNQLCESIGHLCCAIADQQFESLVTQASAEDQAKIVESASAAEVMEGMSISAGYSTMAKMFFRAPGFAALHQKFPASFSVMPIYRFDPRIKKASVMDIATLRSFDRRLSGYLIIRMLGTKPIIAAKKWEDGKPQMLIITRVSDEIVRTTPKNPTTGLQTVDLWRDERWQKFFDFSQVDDTVHYCPVQIIL